MASAASVACLSEQVRGQRPSRLLAQGKPTQDCQRLCPGWDRWPWRPRAVDQWCTAAYGPRPWRPGYVLPRNLPAAPKLPYRVDSCEERAQTLVPPEPIGDSQQQCAPTQEALSDQRASAAEQQETVP